MYFVYILSCADRSLYTGIAKDVQKRVKEHNDGKGAKYTRARRPVKLVYKKKVKTRSAALKEEYKIKQLSRGEKLALINGKMKLRLLLPNKKNKKAFLSALRDFQSTKEPGRGFNSLNYGEIKKDFDAFIAEKKKQRGETQPKGRVPNTTYWLFDGNTMIGEIDIRHRLNKKLKVVGGHIGYSIRPSKWNKGYGTKMLALGLKKCRQMGLQKVMITCDEDNMGSRRVIEKNGGIYKKSVKADWYENGNKPLRQYWVTIT